MITLHIGRFRSQEKIWNCEDCRRIYGFEELRLLVPFGGNFGYDVFVYAGRALCVRHRRSQEIRDELAAQTVQISSIEVEDLGTRFLMYLAIAYRQAARHQARAIFERRIHSSSRCNLCWERTVAHERLRLHHRNRYE